MNAEELKIIISAETEKLQKGIDESIKGMKGLEKSGGKTSSSMKSFGSAAGAAIKTVVGAAAAAGAAIIALSKGTEQLRQEQAKLNTAFVAAGGSTETAAKAYGNLFRFLGDSGKATEAAGHLAKLTTNEQELAEWTTALQGVYATYGDSLPIEALTEAANETAKVGTVTGAMADALNWAGINEDAFNESLAACSGEQERQRLILDTLNGTYSEAALLYEKNNQEILKQNEAQNNLNQTMAQLGKVTTPLITAVTNLASTFLSALAPAINAVMPYIVSFVNMVSTAVSWVSALVSSLLGTKKAGAEAGAGMGNAIQGVSAGANNAAKSVDGIGSSLNDATKEAEKLKRATAGFDELNVMNSGSSGGSGGSGGSGSSGGGIGAISGGVTVGSDLGLTDAFDDTADKAGKFAEKIKNVFESIKTKVGEYLELFSPTVEAWGGAFEDIKLSWDNVKDNFYNGAVNIWDSVSSLNGYLLDEFIPSVTNSFSENLAPLWGDVSGFWLEEAGKSFEMYGEQMKLAVDEIIVPALEDLKEITTDALDTVGKEWEEHGEELTEKISTAADGLRETWDKFYKEFVLPIADAIRKFVKEVWDEHLKPLWDKLVDAVMSIASDLTDLWNKVLKPILDWILEKLYPKIKSAFNNILSVIKTVIGAISGILGGIIDVIKGIVKFITGVFTGDWKKAWEGVKTIITGVWDAIWAAIKGIINLIIGGINKLWSGIYKAVKGIVDTIGKVAGVVGDLLGQNWKFSLPEKPPQIPKLATGGIVVNETLARIGEGNKKEAVLPLEQNTGWMDVLADRIANRNSTPSKLVLMLDGKELGWASINNINNITKQTGNLPLVLA